MHARYCYGKAVRLSVCLSVCLSVKHVDCDKTKELSANILIPYETSMHLVLWHEEWLLGVLPFYLKFSAKVTDPLQKCRFPIDNRSAYCISLIQVNTTFLGVSRNSISMFDYVVAFLGEGRQFEFVSTEFYSWLFVNILKFLTFWEKWWNSWNWNSRSLSLVKVVTRTVCM